MAIEILGIWRLLMVDRTPPQIQSNGVQHHYMHGLCFDSMWSYRAQARAGHRRWTRLDLEANGYPWAEKDDPEGAGWCVRCCASVLGGRPVPLAYMRLSAAPAGDLASVASALQVLLPQFGIHIWQGSDQAVIQDVADTINGGGGVLARLERRHPLRQIPPCWVWVVGMEAKPVSLCLSCNQARSLLLVGRELQPTWACGYGAKAVLTDEGSWMVRGVDGQAWTGVFSSLIAMVPR